MTQLRPTTLTDRDGHAFTYTLPDALLESLAEFDRHASGTIQIDEQVTNEATRNTYLVSSLMEEAITSSQLEGAATTRAVAKDMLRSGRSPVDHGERMILNNYLAMQRIREVVDQPLTPDLLLELHRIVSAGTLENPADEGRLQRPGDPRIAVYDDDDVTVLHTPPPAHELPARLDAMCAFANGETPSGYLHPVLRSMILHFWLGHDHPFADGNGRTARALFYWSMLKHGYWLAEFLSISEVLKRKPGQYKRAYLRTERDAGDLTHFVLFHTTVLREAIDSLHQYLRRRMTAMQDTTVLLREQRGLNHRQLALLAHAIKHADSVPRYTLQGHQTAHAIVYETARQDLRDLESRGLLIAHKQGRKLVFAAATDLHDRLEAGAQTGTGSD
jgi:Fic family protein